jgi:hypothetical protein
MIAPGGGNAAQSQGKLYELWCLIDGEKSAANIDVNDLKKLIYNEAATDVSHPHNIMLWKVHHL